MLWKAISSDFGDCKELGYNGFNSSIVVILWSVWLWLKFSQIITVWFLRVNEIVWYVKCRMREKKEVASKVVKLWYCYCTFSIYYLCKVIYDCVWYHLCKYFLNKRVLQCLLWLFFVYMNGCWFTWWNYEFYVHAWGECMQNAM